MLKGTQECTDLIKEFAGDRQTLRILIGALTDKAVLAGKPSYSSVSKHISLFGLMSKIFKKELVDPLDKPATRKRTFDRIQTFLL
jgi:hypothetical protein